MLCYDVSLNGRRICLAGAENLRLLEAHVMLEPVDAAAHLTVGAHSAKVGISTEDLRWVHQSVSHGDRIEINIVDSLTPDAPQRTKLFGTREKPDGTVEEACSFCAASIRDGSTLIRGWAGNICRECVDVCNEVLADERKEQRS